MSFPWFGPSREEIEILSHDLIVRHGMEAHDEAVHLSEVSRFLGSSRNDKLYRLAADEIKRSFETAWAQVLNKQTGATVSH
jgi:hypothetical protein